MLEEKLDRMIELLESIDTKMEEDGIDLDPDDDADPEPDPPELTAEAVQDIIRDAAKKDRSKTIAVLKKFKAKKATDLKEEDYEEVTEKLKKIIGT